MAEIEFKRRGTPVWAVLLVLLVVAGILYGVFARRGGQPAAVPTDTVTTPTGPAATTAPAATPAPAVAPLVAYDMWADSAKAPAGGPELARYVASGLRAALPVIKERAPMSGVQQVLISASADTLEMPTTSETKQTEVAQAAFYAVSYAQKTSGADTTKANAAAIENAAAAIQLKTPLSKQRDAVQNFFKSAAKAWRATTVPAKP